MSEPRPFYKKYRTKKGYYVYDVNTNLIINLDAVGYELVDHLPLESKADAVQELSGAYSAAEVEAALNKLDFLRREFGFLMPVRIQSRMKSPEFVRQNVRRMTGHFEQLTLSVTEQCNLRCSYCAYSGGYKNIRTHNNKAMSWSVAHGMTTNATLLRDPVADFLVENNIRILVSLDGPKENHDKERRFLGGQESYDLIMRRLLRLKERYPDYYANRVRFQVTLNPATDYGETLAFLTESPDIFLAPSKVSFGYVSEGFDEFLDAKRNSERGRLGAGSAVRALCRFEEKLAMGETDDREFGFLQTLFEKPYLNIHKRPIRTGGFGDTYHFMTACFPGHYRLFVQANGTFQVCEKSNDALVIGHVDTGLDYEKVCDLYQKYHDLQNKECRRCWIHRFCDNCYVSNTRGEGHFRNVLDPHHCQETRDAVEENFTRYSAVVEANPNAFDYMREVKQVGAKIPVLQIAAD